MRIHEEPTLTSEEYKNARIELGLTQEQLAYETGTNLSTIKKRESGDSPVRREAHLTLRWLAANPPTTPPAHVIAAYRTKSEGHQEGDRFGLFTITRATRSSQRPVAFDVRCECGKEKFFMAANFHCRSRCGPFCPAYDAMIARGSHINEHGEVIDQEGLPEY